MSFCIPADHPALPGHFPGNPIVPGVLILDYVFDVMKKEVPDHQVVGIRKLKFMFPLLPGQEFEVICGTIKNGYIRFRCVSGEKLVVEGNLQLAAIS